MHCPLISIHVRVVPKWRGVCSAIKVTIERAQYARQMCLFNVLVGAIAHRKSPRPYARNKRALKIRVQPHVPPTPGTHQECRHENASRCGHTLSVCVPGQAAAEGRELLHAFAARAGIFRRSEGRARSSFTRGARPRISAGRFLGTQEELVAPIGHSSRAIHD
jgi:hypothetical protein